MGRMGGICLRYAPAVQCEAHKPHTWTSVCGYVYAFGIRFDMPDLTSLNCLRHQLRLDVFASLPAPLSLYHVQIENNKFMNYKMFFLGKFSLWFPKDMGKFRFSEISRWDLCLFVIPVSCGRGSVWHMGIPERLRFPFTFDKHFAGFR